MLKSFRLFKLLRPSLPRTRVPSWRAQHTHAPESAKPLYECIPPWWGRFTYLLVGADLVVTAAACELTWSHWTVWEDGDGKEAAGRYVARPWYIRGGFALGQLFLGVAVASLLLGGRSRLVRRLWILPPLPAPALDQTGKDARRLRIQSMHHFRRQGKEYPLRHCMLKRGVDEKEMLIHVADVRGRFWVGLEGASINGEKLPVWKARDAIYTSWYGEEKGRKLRAEEKWKSGPVLKNA
ncbi:hypothetical protein B0H21DRAFT_701452 [Amylocystis lapponica]|nr:hypothetical protein B0H21DRAFT_701452 [Amylocystis lapponica]